MKTTKQLIEELLQYPMDAQWEVFDGETPHCDEQSFSGLICRDEYGLKYEINILNK